MFRDVIGDCIKNDGPLLGREEVTGCPFHGQVRMASLQALQLRLRPLSVSDLGQVTQLL